MRFQELRFSSEVVRLRVNNVLTLCKKINEEGPQRIDAASMKDLIGQGTTGKILRQVFIKTHNGVSRGDSPQPAEWAINRRAYSDLIASYKFYLGDKNDLEEIFFETEKVKQVSGSVIEEKYRALAGK